MNTVTNFIELLTALLEYLIFLMSVAYQWVVDKAYIFPININLIYGRQSGMQVGDGKQIINKCQPNYMIHAQHWRYLHSTPA